MTARDGLSWVVGGLVAVVTWVTHVPDVLGAVGLFVVANVDYVLGMVATVAYRIAPRVGLEAAVLEDAVFVLALVSVSVGLVRLGGRAYRRFGD